ncbi:MAG: hypothetical protein LBE05_05745 [Microbacterium sp.]|nr:hypothetical protein [Microbacterium sp.]
MELPFGETVHRLRPASKVDPYSKKPIPADWATAVETEIPGAFVASSSTSRNVTASRTQIVTEKSLYCDPSFDVQPTDRIRAGGVVYTIDGIASADTNPFTGWQPIREVLLTRFTG